MRPPTSLIIATSDNVGEQIAERFAGQSDPPLIHTPLNSQGLGNEQVQTLLNVILLISLGDSPHTTKERFTHQVLFPISICHQLLSNRAPLRKLTFILGDSCHLLPSELFVEWVTIRETMKGFYRNLRRELWGQLRLSFDIVTLNQMPALLERAL